MIVMRKGFTLVELLVVVVISIVIGSLIYGCVRTSTGWGDSTWDFNPQRQRNNIELRKTEALEEQNRLMQEMLRKQSEQ